MGSHLRIVYSVHVGFQKLQKSQYRFCKLILGISVPAPQSPKPSSKPCDRKNPDFCPVFHLTLPGLDMSYGGSQNSQVFLVRLN